MINNLICFCYGILIGIEICLVCKTEFDSKRSSVMDKSEIDRMKYMVCCPLCDHDKCCRGTDKCDAERWAKGKEKEVEDGK